MSMNFTRLEYDDGDRHRKYWQVELVGSIGSGYLVNTEWGRLGSRGSSQVKMFQSLEDAQKHVERMINEKRRKGYAEAVTFGREEVVAARKDVEPVSTEMARTADEYMSLLTRDA